MENQKSIDYAKAIEDLEKKLNALSAPYEDALAYRVFQKSQDQFKKWIAVWAGVLTAILLFFGVKGYGEIVDAGKRQASEIVITAATTKLQDVIKEEFAKAREQARETVMKSSLELTSSIDKALAELLQETQDQTSEHIKIFATRVGTALKDPSIASSVHETAREGALHAWAYYGIRSDKGWQTSYFKNETRNEAELPQTGDIVVAKSPVNARGGIIEFDPNAGWVNKPALGAIKKDNRLKVLRVEPVKDNSDFIWIEFERIG
jgi:hypothetical protein